MKLALYRNMVYDYTTIAETRLYENETNYVRISDDLDVEFVMLPKDDYAAGAMAAFDEQEKAVALQYAEKMEVININRQEFLAITHDGEE